MVRNILVVFSIVIDTIIFGVMCLIVSPFDWRGHVHGWIIRIWAKIDLWLIGVEISVKGLENLEDTNPSVILMNHESALDILIVLAGLPINQRFMAKKELFKIPIFGWGLAFGGHISIDRANTKKAVESINKNSKRIIKKKLNIIVSPEGTRSPDGEMGSFKKGGFKLAEKYDLPLIPVTILGSRYCIPKKKLTVTPGRVGLIIDSAVKVSDFPNLVSCMNSVRETMIHNKDEYESERIEKNIA